MLPDTADLMLSTDGQRGPIMPVSAPPQHDIMVTDDELRDMLKAQEEESEELSTLVAPRTQLFRERVWREWQRYPYSLLQAHLQCTVAHTNKHPSFAERLGFHPESMWIEFRLGQKPAKHRCIVFLKLWAKNGRALRPCLGPDEWEWVRTINCAVTVEDVWAALVNTAEAKVMRPKRESDPMNGAFWTLQYNSRSRGSRDTPSHEVAKVGGAIHAHHGI